KENSSTFWRSVAGYTLKPMRAFARPPQWVGYLQQECRPSISHPRNARNLIARRVQKSDMSARPRPAASARPRMATIRLERGANEIYSPDQTFYDRKLNPMCNKAHNC